MFYDAHNHLQDDWLAPHWAQIERDLANLPLAGVVVNGTHPDDWGRVRALAQRLPWVLPSYGVHPWHCGRRPVGWQQQLDERLAAEPGAHVGEIGIDRWILESARPDDPRLVDTVRAPLEEQVAVFRGQLELARRHERVASVHCLQAFGRLHEIVQETPPPGRGWLLHAYAGPVEMVPQWVALGAYFSFGPAFLDPRKTRQRAAFRVVPPERVLVETDAPAMPPPLGCTEFALPPDAASGCRVNHPGNVAAAYQGLAELRGVAEPELREQVAANFRRLFEGRS